MRSTEDKQNANRSCVVCRAPCNEMQRLRLFCIDGSWQCGTGKSGRGAYVCLQESCVAALSERHLAKSFRGKQEPFELEPWVRQAATRAERQVFQLLGLARRAGALEFGVEQAKERLERSSDALIIVASDLADRSQIHSTKVKRFATKQALGHACGRGNVGALWVRQKSFAEQVLYWLNVIDVMALVEMNFSVSKKGA